MKNFQVLYFNREDWTPDELESFCDTIKLYFSNLVFLPKTVSLISYDKNELKEIQSKFNNIVNVLLEEEKE